jgi:hypothetical protein
MMRIEVLHFWWWIELVLKSGIQIFQFFFQSAKYNYRRLLFYYDKVQILRESDTPELIVKLFQEKLFFFMQVIIFLSHFV